MLAKLLKIAYYAVLIKRKSRRDRMSVSRKYWEVPVAIAAVVSANLTTTAAAMHVYDTVDAYIHGQPIPVSKSKWSETDELYESRRYVAVQANTDSTNPFACVLNQRVLLQSGSKGWSSVEGLVGNANDGACKVGSLVMPGQISRSFIDRLADERSYWDTAMKQIDGLATAPTFSFPKTTRSYTGAYMVTKAGDAELSPDDVLTITSLYDGLHRSSGYQYGPGQCTLGEGDAGTAEVRDYGKVAYGAGFLSVGVVTRNSNLGDFSCPQGSLILGSTTQR